MAASLAVPNAAINLSYYIIRVHGNKADKLPCTLDENNKNIISFKTGLFSTYVLMYEDKKDSQGGNNSGPIGGPGTL
mgnify:CR=1 FL=1